MAEKAAQLTDHVIPEVPVRQWVLSLPYKIRYRLAYDKDACTIALRAFVRTVFTDLRRRAKHHHGVSGGKPGGVTFIQRFASSLALNVHFYSILMDGVYVTRNDGTIRFVPLPSPTDEEVVTLTKKVGRSVRRALERAGKCLDELDPEPDSLAVDDPTLASLYGSSVVGRIATGTRAGREVERIGDRVTVGGAEQLTSRRCARVRGFSLHADVAVPARDRKRVERLVRYIARPPLANERLHRRSDGKLVYQFRKPWRDGTRGVVFTPAELIEKLIALIPPPQANLLRYHGVLAPGSKLRSHVVVDRRPPAGAKVPKEPAPGMVSRSGGPPKGDPMKISDSPSRGVSRVHGPVGLSGDEAGEPLGLTREVSVGHEVEVRPRPGGDWLPSGSTREPLTFMKGPLTPKLATRRRMSWAELLKRVFQIDVLECPICSGQMKIIAEITEPKVIKRFLAALDLSSEVPKIERARPPPQMDLGWTDEVVQDAAVEAEMNTYDGA